MGKAETFNPPPPYTANDFDRVDPPPTAPQYGVVPGVAPQPEPSQMGVPPPEVHRVIDVENPLVDPDEERNRFLKIYLFCFKLKILLILLVTLVYINWCNPLYLAHGVLWMMFWVLYILWELAQ